MRHDLLFAIKGGTFARIKYEASVPVAAAYKKQGVVIKKEVETTGRFGVNYGHIKTVIERKAQETEEKKPRTNNYEAIVPNRYLHNTNTNKDYVQMAILPKHSNTKVQYYINGKEATFDDIKPYVIESYINPKPGNVAEIRTIDVNNVKWIKQGGKTA